MLGEVTSEEISEWSSYFKVKERYFDEYEIKEKAKEKAKQQGR